jgi:hypothetical protein
MGKTNGKSAKCQQMQGCDQRQSIDMKSFPSFRLRPMVCWWRDEHLVIHWNRHHMLISLSEAATSDPRNNGRNVLLNEKTAFRFSHSTRCQFALWNSC